MTNLEKQAADIRNKIARLSATLEYLEKLIKLQSEQADLTKEQD